MVKQIIKVRENILYSVIFAIFFIVAGYYIPRFYYQNLDTQKYVHIFHPVTQVENRMFVDPRQYEPCDTAEIYFTRTSEIDTSGTVDLGLYKIDEFEKSALHLRKTLSVDKGNRNISYDVKLPCDLEEGSYFVRGSFNYSYKEASKNISFTTDNFKIQQ